jgi:hypothetical protein
MEERGGLLIQCLLKFRLCWTCSRQISYPPRSTFVLYKRICEAFSYFCRLVDLFVGWCLIGVLDQGEEFLKFGEEESDTSFELDKIFVGSLIHRFGGHGLVEVGFAEEGVAAIFAYSNIDTYSLIQCNPFF